MRFWRDFRRRIAEIRDRDEKSAPLTPSLQG